MKPGFTLHGGLLTSALVPLLSESVLHLRDRVTLTRALAVGPCDTLACGATGTIDYIDASTGACEVLMDKRCTSLDAWDNHLWLEPFSTPEFLAGVRVSGPRWCPSVTRRAAVVLGVSLALSLVAAVAHNFFYVEPEHTLTLIANFDEATHVFTRVFTVSVLVATALASTA